MLEVIRSPRAQADIDEIAFYIGLDNESAMHRWLEKLEEAFELLGSLPNSGTARPELAVELRSFPIGSYLIFYRVAPQAVRIVRIIHGARDLPAIFGQ